MIIGKGPQQAAAPAAAAGGTATAVVEPDPGTSVEQAVASTGAAAQVLSAQHRPANQGSTRVVEILPGLLISQGRLNTKELTRLATQLALSSIVELGLQVGGAALPAAAAVDLNRSRWM
jgi:hypothetical protein